MIFIVYSETHERTLRSQLGRPEYSYFFVRKQFQPALQQLGKVVVVTDPETEVDPIYHDAIRRAEPCVFLSFSPPHRTPLGLECPTVPVIAWEFDTIPYETWYAESEQDWRFVLNKLGRAITHCAHTVTAVKSQLGDDFPIVSIPSPVWDNFASRYREDAPATAKIFLKAAGKVLDTRDLHLPWPFGIGPSAKIALDGVVYMSILNPNDGRKNTSDMIDGFCHAFRDIADATLVLKLTHHNMRKAVAALRDRLEKLKPYKCRIVFITGYLDAPAYEGLVSAASYAVNASNGEGQCLPLMELMACGRPAVAPCHTGMADYVNAGNSFVVRTSSDPTYWPQDPRNAYRTMRQRIDFESLVEAYRESYRVAKNEPQRYSRMAHNAHETLQRHCSIAVSLDRLEKFFALPARPALFRNEYGMIKPRVDAPWLNDISESTRYLNYGDEFASAALSFAQRGATVHVVDAPAALRETASIRGKRYRLDLSTYKGAFGFNPSAVAGFYDFISFSTRFYDRLSDKNVLDGFRNMLSDNGRILVSRKLRTATESNGIAREAVPFIEQDLLDWFRNAGFTWRNYDSKFDDNEVVVYDFSPWNKPLKLGECALRKDEASTWHHGEPGGRWTKEKSFLDLPVRDGVIEISARNHRKSRSLGCITFGDQTQPFALEPGGTSLTMRFTQSAALPGQRLIIFSDVDIGGPTDPRALGLYIETITPL